MKRILSCIVILLLMGSITQAEQKKSGLKILYVGGSSDLETIVTKVDPLVLQRSIAERMASFEEMLKTYFETVKVVDAKDYVPEMSNLYDVTLFDGRPRELTPRIVEKNEQGRIIRQTEAGYLPETFDRPAVMLVEMGHILGRRIGLKIDWYCLCLDSDAHSFRTEHPIFHGPFPVKMTVRMEPTQEAAFHYAYMVEEPVPDSVLMWKVQNYPERKGARIGMVSYPGGFEDSPDAEVISSGVCAKSLDAVAIGRHGNFLHWGFAGSPKYMTEEAKAVLANAIVYISGFADQTPIARKYENGIATRSYIKEKKYLASRKAWEDRTEQDKVYSEYFLGEKKKAEEKQQKGEALTDEEKGYLNYVPAPSKTYEELLKRYQHELFEQFGTDEEAYRKYYDENCDYFYGEGIYNLVIDEGVKSWGISNHDLRLLDKAIGLWEKGQDVEKARRVLNRYTLCRFATAKEWRDWYETNKGRMFFTESGGWLFMVNTRDKSVSGNDYSVRNEESNVLPQTEATDLRNPVQVAVGINQLGGGKQEVVIRVKIHAGYHIYAHVVDSDPFIPTTIGITVPSGYQAVGDLKRSAFKGFNKSGTTIYENEAVFRQEIVGSGEGEVTCTIEYQCCDSHVCMTPVKKEYIIKI